MQQATSQRKLSLLEPPFDAELREAWATHHGLTPATQGVISTHRLVPREDRETCLLGSIERCLPPGADHGELWARDRKAWCLTSQPYGPLDQEALEATVEYCERHGLTFDVSTWPAWWAPGKVLFLRYWRAGFHFDGTPCDKKQGLEKEV